MNQHAPASAPILDSIIFDDSLSASVFRTYCRLVARAWRHNYQRTDPIDLITGLLPLLGLVKSKVYDHLNILKAAKLLLWSTNDRGSYTFTFPSLAVASTESRQQGQQGTGLQRPSAAPDPAATQQIGQETQADKTDHIDDQEVINVVKVPNSGLCQSPEFGTLKGLSEEDDDEDTDTPTLQPLLLLLHEDQSPEFGTLKNEVGDRACRAMIAGGIWTDEAEREAQRFAAGSARITLRDLLENVAYVHDPESDIDKPGAIMRIHVRSQRKSPRRYPDMPEDFDEALEWAQHPERWGTVEVDDVQPDSVTQPALLECPAEPPALQSSWLPAFDESDWGGRWKPSQLWQAAQGELQLQMTVATYNTWVKETYVVNYTNDRVTIGVRNQYTLDWWKSRLMQTVHRIVAGIAGREIDVEFVVALTTT